MVVSECTPAPLQPKLNLHSEKENLYFHDYWQKAQDNFKNNSAFMHRATPL
jgi:hypothetical protein